MPPDKNEKLAKSSQLISSFFQPSLRNNVSAEVQTSKSPTKAKRICLSRLGSSNHIVRPVARDIMTEVSSVLNTVNSNNFARSLQFSSLCVETHTDPSLNSYEKKCKLTPLEEQVVQLRNDSPNLLLVVEVGYKFRFFGEDACKASQILGIPKYKKNSFDISQVPSHRLGITVRRLVDSGLKVGVVLQSEAAATKSADLTHCGKSGTFQRRLSRVYSAGTILDDDIIGDDSIHRKTPQFVDNNDDEADDLHLLDQESPRCTFQERWLVCILGETVVTGSAVILSVVFANIESCKVCHGMFEDNTERNSLCSLLRQFDPVEVIFSDDEKDETIKAVERFKAVKNGSRSSVHIACLSSVIFELESARHNIRRSFLRHGCDQEASMAAREWTKCYSFPELTERCLGGMIGHLSDRELHRTLIGQFINHMSVEPIEAGSTNCFIDPSSLCDLEIFHALGDQGETGSLMSFLDRTVTASGSRTLRDWLRTPLASIEAIEARSHAMELIKSCSVSDDDISLSLTTLLQTLRTNRGIDLNVACAQLVSRHVTPQRFLAVVNATSALASALPSLRCLEECFTAASPLLATELRKPPRELILGCCALLSSLVRPNANGDKAQSLQKGNWHVDIQEHQHDETSQLARALTDALSPLQKAEQSCLKIEKALNDEIDSLSKQLKICLQFKHLRVGTLGALEYLVELPAKMTTPDGWKIINSTQQFHRYRPPTINHLHQELLRMKEDMCSTAAVAWDSVLKSSEEVLLGPIRSLASALAIVDALNSMACVSSLPGFVKPSFRKEGKAHSRMVVVQGRHPTMEALLQKKGETTVPNDISVSQNGGPRNISVITGPNMGGKSTYARMVAVLAIMGQIGYYLPCDSARLVIFDQIFTRIGVDDDLARGMSTFFVELDRSSRILRSVTPNSLVLLDELGRGTSTHDGVAVAKATLLYLAETAKCTTLFVTHFPEITAFASQSILMGQKDNTSFTQHTQVVSLHMDFIASSSADFADVVFLFKAVEGGTSSSHGLNVAQMAGLPRHLLDLALGKVSFRVDPLNDTSSRKSNDGDLDLNNDLACTYQFMVEAQVAANLNRR